VFILDDGQPRANFIQPPEVAMNLLTNGPPGYVLGVAYLGGDAVALLGDGTPLRIVHAPIIGSPP
jgi:hypothetical protein